MGIFLIWYSIVGRYPVGVAGNPCRFMCSRHPRARVASGDPYVMTRMICNVCLEEFLVDSSEEFYKKKWGPEFVPASSSTITLPFQVATAFHVHCFWCHSMHTRLVFQIFRSELHINTIETPLTVKYVNAACTCLQGCCSNLFLFQYT